MIRRMPSVRRLAPIAALALVAGAAVAQASGGGGATTPAPVAVVPSRAPAAATLVDAGPPAVRIVARGSGAPAAPISMTPGTITTAAPVVACRPSKGSASKAPASQAAPSDVLTDAFGILRRDRNDDDTLPAAALTALKRSGLTPVDAQSARLLRADGAARAWVVPVPDVGVANRFACVKSTDPREGLAVVSVGGAPAGGGGALRDLLRGLAPASVDPCAGASHDMIGVSGIVPDDIDAVFVTAADGTATRADVHDNGYTFVLPDVRRLQSRYLVWTGKDGAPHVQPLAVLPFGPSKTACGRLSSTVRVTPAITDFACGPFGAAPVFRQQFPLVVPKTSVSKRSRAAERRAAARRAALRRAAARRAATRRKAGRSKAGHSKPGRLVPLPYVPLPVCAPSAVVQIAPGSGRILPQAVPPRVGTPTVTVPAAPRAAPAVPAPRRAPAPTATRPAAPGAGAPVVTVPATPRPRTTP
jgi:hypothetical protein